MPGGGHSIGWLYYIILDYDELEWLNGCFAGVVFACLVTLNASVFFSFLNFCVLGLNFGNGHEHYSA